MEIKKINNELFCYLDYDGATIVSKLIKTPYQENTFKLEIIEPYKKLQIRYSRGYIPYFARNKFMSEAEYYPVPEKNKNILIALSIKLYEFSKELDEKIHNIVNSKEYLDFLIDFKSCKNEYKQTILKWDFEKKIFNNLVSDVFINIHDVLENYIK